jgi:hypothetical protein
MLPQPKPRAVCEHFVVPPIGSGEVALGQRSNVRYCQDALKALNFGDSLLGIHPVSISNISTATVKPDGINDVSAKASRAQTSFERNLGRFDCSIKQR